MIINMQSVDLKFNLLVLKNTPLHLICGYERGWNSDLELVRALATRKDLKFNILVWFLVFLESLSWMFTKPCAEWTWGMHIYIST